MVYKNCLRHRNGLTSSNNLLSCVVGLNLVHCRGVGGERIAVWMSVKLAVWQAERVKQYGLLSLPASKSAHTGRDPWTPLFTLLAAALTLWQLDLQLIFTFHIFDFETYNELSYGESLNSQIATDENGPWQQFYFVSAKNDAPEVKWGRNNFFA